MSSYFEYYETRADGEQKENVQRIPYSEARTLLALRYPGPMGNLLHFIDLSCAAPGFPVDVTHWKNGELVYSGRLKFFLGDVTERSRVILAAGS